MVSVTPGDKKDEKIYDSKIVQGDGNAAVLLNSDTFLTCNVRIKICAVLIAYQRAVSRKHTRIYVG